MLTIHTPIGLTADSSILTVNDNFTERLMGNYQVIGNGLAPEDMLHFVSAPPEVYLAEGGMTALVENQTIYNDQNLKMNLVNNVLNRILVSDTYEMTYQDRVFIESILKKIGVTDVQNFMKQVQNLSEETKNINDLTDLYWSEREMVSAFFEYRRMQQKEEAGAREEEEKGNKESILWLHQQIMNRLQTGAVYQELHNYISTTANHNERISETEMQIAEQNIIARNILLNKLRSYTMLEEQPLVYHFVNAYEMGKEESYYENSTQTVNQLVRAVLLNAIHQMYALRAEELLKQNNVWYQLAGALYQTAENTFRRFETYQNQHFMSEQDADVYSKNVQNYQKNEIWALRQLHDDRIYHAVQNREQKVTEAQNLTYLNRMDGSAFEESAESASFSEAAGRLIQDAVKQEQQFLSLSVQANLLKNQLEKIEQSNLQNQHLLRQMNIQKNEQTLVLENGGENMQEDALLSLPQLEKEQLEYLESLAEEQPPKITEKEKLTKVFGKEAVRILETLKKYQTMPKYAGTPTKTEQEELQRIQDIRQHELERLTELVHKTQETAQETVQEKELHRLLQEYLRGNPSLMVQTPLTEEAVKQENVLNQIEEVLYQIAENTFRQYETSHAQSFLSQKEADVYRKNVQQMQKNELRTWQQLRESHISNTEQNIEQTRISAPHLTYLNMEGEEGEVQRWEDGQQPEKAPEKPQDAAVHGQQILPLREQEALLKNQLEKINQNNIQNQHLLQQLNLQKNEQTTVLKVNRERAREDALRALSEPEAVVSDYLETRTREEQKEILEKEKLTNVFGEETIRIFETLEKYQKSPQYAGIFGRLGQGEARLMQDIRQHELEMQTELVERTQELTRQTISGQETHQLFKEYLPENVRQMKQEIQKRIERAEIVYKQEESALDEEMLEEIRSLQRTTKVQQEQVTEQVVEKNISHEVINSRINEMQTRQNEELVQMLTDKMQRQLGSISEQVYGKLEKRMEIERRRRGL